MADDAFRQQRKKEKITPEEIAGEPKTEPTIGDSGIGDREKLEKMMAIQKQAGVDVPTDVPPDAAFSHGQSPEGLQVSGNVPPIFQNKLKDRINEVDSGADPAPFGATRQTSPQEAPMMPPGQGGRPPLRPGEMVTSDPSLNALLTGLSTQTYEVVTLPSRGRFYDGADSPTDGVLHIRPMTGQEETVLSTVRFMRGGRGIEMIFKACIQEKNINTEKLLSLDRTFLLIYLRAISYGNLYEVSVRCPECDHQFDYDIDLNLPIDYCPENFTNNDLTRTLPKSGYLFKYRLMTGDDETQITAYRDRRAKFSNAIDDSFLYKAATLVEEIGNKEAKITNRTAIQSLLERLPAQDVNYIRNTVNEPPFGVDTKVQVICPACARDFPVELPYEANFFFPREKTEIEL